MAKSAAIGLNAERLGILSPADYTRWQQTDGRVSGQKSIDDSDLDWAISMMQKPSTDPADVNIMMMSLFLTVNTFQPDQPQKIRAAVTPLLSSHVHVERKFAKDVIKKLG